jgi:outer membrane protein assembly factor BamA
MLLALLLAAQVAAAEVVAEVRIHGNHTTPNDAVLALVGDVVGQPASDALLADIAARIEKSGRFSAVEVRKRYRSIDNPADILLIVVVDERPGVSETEPVVGPWKRITASGMWLPVLHYSDGYGFTYGARFSFIGGLGPRSRITVPLTWGGERQAQVEVERSFERGPIARLVGGGGILRRENPFYDIGDTRTEARVRAESAPRPWLQFGAGTRLADVRFGDYDDRVSGVGADATLDTRVDPAYPRNAVMASVGWERVGFSGLVPPAASEAPPIDRSGSFHRTTTDLRGFVGLMGSSVLAVRGFSVLASSPPPPYEQALLGGASTLRGYDAGYRAGDNLVAAAAEVRIPFTSPIDIGRFGVRAFADWGAVYPHGARMADQRLEAGYGAGVFIHLTVLTMGMDWAWSEYGDFNFHFSMGVQLGRR